MKRQASSPTVTSSPEHKRAKTFQGLVQPASSTEDASEWTKVEKRKQKKQKKSMTKLDSAQPRFMYSNAEIAKRRTAVSIDDIRELIIHIVADAPPPNWVRTENPRSIQKVVSLWIPGLTSDFIGLSPASTSATANPDLPLSIPLAPKTIDGKSASALPFISETFSHACPTIAPGDSNRMHSVLSSFFSGPVSGDEKKRRMVQRFASERSIQKDPMHYVLSLEDMIENEYPIPSYLADVFEKPVGWVETPEEPKQSLLSEGNEAKVKTARKVYAIDCEMCLTENGKELARVSVIDYYTGIVIYDQLVKPSKPIIDYLTKWSGITEAALAPVTTTLADVQAQVLRLLHPVTPPTNPFTIKSADATTPLTSSPPTAILLGHSLESDLKALKICHPYCIDTALAYHHPRGRPLKPGLAWLTRKWLGREIQTRGEGGHDPEEDARACIDLLKKKIENGEGFGEFKTDYESIFERMGRSAKRNGDGGKVRGAVVDHGNPSVMHGSKASTSVACKGDEEVLKGLMEVIPSHEFAYGRFIALADALGWTSPKQEQTANPPIQTIPPRPSAETLAPVVDTLNSQLLTLRASLPPRTALIIFTGHSDPRRMAALNAKKSFFETALRSGKRMEDIPRESWWTTVDGRDLEDEVALARRGLLFLYIKQ